MLLRALALTALACLFALQAHADAPPLPKPAHQWRLGDPTIPPLQVAVLLPMSGKQAALGGAALDGLRWASMWLEVPIAFSVYDTRADSAHAASLTAALRDHSDTVALLGPLGHQTARAAASVASPLPMLSLSSADDVEALGPTVFRARLSAEDQARGMAALAASALKLSRAAIAFPDDDYGRACARAFASTFTDLGGQVVAFEPYPPQHTKLQPVAAKIFGRAARSPLPNGLPAPKQRPQAIFIPDDGPQVVRLLPFLDAQGDLSQTQLLGLSSWQGESLKLSNGFAAGALLPFAFDDRASPEVEAAVAAFEDAFSRPPSALEAQTHDALMLLAQALRRCGHLPDVPSARACVAQRLQSGEPIHGLTGPLSLTPARGPARDLLIFEVDAHGSLWPTY